VRLELRRASASGALPMCVSRASSYASCVARPPPAGASHLRSRASRCSSASGGRLPSASWSVRLELRELRRAFASGGRLPSASWSVRSSCSSASGGRFPSASWSVRLELLVLACVPRPRAYRRASARRFARGPVDTAGRRGQSRARWGARAARARAIALRDL